METNWKQPGYILRDRYRFGEVLGEGGYGIIYRAYDMRTRESVAVKELKRSAEITYISMMRRMKQFGKVSGMVQIKDVMEDEGVTFVVMEYLEGINLMELLKEKGKLTQAQTVYMMKPIVAAVEYLHSQGMLHRDISTDNIIVDKEGCGTLIDLDCVCEYTDDAKILEIQSVKQGFSPEEFYYETGKIGTWSDVYEICASLYHIMTGIVPVSAVERGQGKRLESLQEKNINIVPIFAEAMNNGLLLDYRERLGNMKTLKQALDMVPEVEEVKISDVEIRIPYVADGPMKTLDGKKAAPESVMPETHVKSGSQQRKKKRKLIALGIISALLLVLGISIGIYVHINNKDENVKSENAKEEEYADKLEKYKQACEMLETRNDVETAVEMLEKLGDFEDSYEYLSETAEEYLSYGHNEEAADIYMYLGNAEYGESILQLFTMADNDVSGKDYKHARTVYEYLGERKDNDGMTGNDGILRCDFNQAYQEKYEEKNYEAARKAFEALGDFYSEDYEISAEEMVELCNHSLALQIVYDKNFDDYENAKEILLDNKDYTAIRTMAQNYFDNMMYTEAMAIYKILDNETNTSYESQIRDCEANQGIQAKYGNYSKENSKSYDFESGTMVKYVDMETAESYLTRIYGVYTAEDKNTMDLTKLELNGEKYGIKDITIDTKSELKIIATIYRLSDIEKDSITLTYEANAAYTYTDDAGNIEEKNANQLTLDGKTYRYR